MLLVVHPLGGGSLVVVTLLYAKHILHSLIVRGER
jgi:hypothetical protein